MTTRVPLGDLVKVVGGGTPTRNNPEFFGGDIPWVTPKDMKSWTIRSSLVSLTPAGLTKSPAHLVPSDSVLVVVRSGVLKHTIPVALNLVPVALNQDMKALICSCAISPAFLARFIKWSSPEILQWVRATTADNFPIDKLKTLEIPVPPMDEQRRIAAILDQADALRAKRREALAHLDDLTQSIFLEMFGSHRDVVTRWPTQSLGDLLEFLTSGSRGWAKHYADEGDLFLRIQNVRRDELVLDDIAFVHAPDTAEAKRTLVREGDVLLSITADLGRTAAVPADLGRAFINQHLSILRVPSVVPRFLSAFLTSEAGQRQIVGRNRQAVKAGLNFDDIRSFTIPTPPKQLQVSFAERIAETDGVEASQNVHSRELDALFTSLQARAFAGEL